jgi:hypothetical protein
MFLVSLSHAYVLSIHLKIKILLLYLLIFVYIYLNIKLKLSHFFIIKIEHIKVNHIDRNTTIKLH